MLGNYLSSLENCVSPSDAVKAADEVCGGSRARSRTPHPNLRAPVFPAKTSRFCSLPASSRNKHFPFFICDEEGELQKAALSRSFPALLTPQRSLSAALQPELRRSQPRSRSSTCCRWAHPGARLRGIPSLRQGLALGSLAHHKGLKELRIKFLSFVLQQAKKF